MPIEKEQKGRVVLFTLREVAAIVLFVLSLGPLAFYTGVLRQEVTTHGAILQDQAASQSKAIDQQTTINERLSRTDAEMLKLTHAMDVRLSALHESHTGLKAEIQAVRAMLQGTASERRE